MRLTALMLILVANAAYAQFAPCVPRLDPAALARVHVANQLCGFHLMSHIYEASGELRGDITIGVDANDAIRVMQNSYDPPFTLVKPDAITHVGQDEPVYWGIWNPATRAGSAMPYVAGVEPRGLPGGVARYSLLGAPFIVSGEINTNPPVGDADNLSHPIEPGPISRADLTVDFGAGTATLNLAFTVRGVGGVDTIEFRRREYPSQEFESVDCEIAHTCSRATLRFYGRGATHAGVLLRVNYERVTPQAARVAALLTNVSGQAAIGLRRR